MGVEGMGDYVHVCVYRGVIRVEVLASLSACMGVCVGAFMQT